MKKNNFKSLAAVLSLAMATTVVPVNTNAAAAPKITVSKKTVYSGKTYSATVTNLKKGYTVQFSSTEGGVNFKAKKVKATGKKVTAKFTVKAAKQIADGAKTKIKAVVKNEKGKTVKTVSQSVTLKQLANSLTVKDVEKTTVTVGEIVNADATIAPAAAKGAYKKTFTSSDSSVLKVTNASNGLFEAVAPGKATISVSAANNKGKVVEGSKTIEITVVAAEQETPGTDEPATPDVKPEEPQDTTGSAITTEYSLSLSSSKAQITADNVDSADITVKLTAPTDATIDKNMVAVAQLALSTKGIGSLSSNEVNLQYSEADSAWVGTVKFTSASLVSNAVSKLTASIVSTINTPEGLNLKGVTAEPMEIVLVAPVKEAEDDMVGAKAVKVVSEDLDRITVTFNKAIKRETFLTTDGKVANGDNVEPTYTNADVAKNKPVRFKLYVADGVSDKDNADDPNVAINKKTFTETDVVDILQVDNSTLTFVLKNVKPLTDNAKFLVYFTDTRTDLGYTKVESPVLNNRTLDTTIPHVGTVTVKNLKTLEVKFDQPLYSVEATARNGKNGNAAVDSQAVENLNDRAALINALSNFNYSIDGQILSQEHKRTDGTSIYGTPNTMKIELADPIARDTVLITLGQDASGKQCYLTSGTHVLQVSRIGDYAALTEVGANNRVETKNFDFVVPENTTEPNFKVTVQSPEQYKVTFTTPIANLEKYTEGQEISATDLPIKLQFKDPAVTTMTDYADACGKIADAATAKCLGQDIKMTKLADDADGNPQVKVEVTRDWANLPGYKNDHKSYYNYSLRLFVGAKALTNAANGRVNSGDCVRPLAGDIITKFDATTPVITEITEIKAGSRYLVSFSEPIQVENQSLYDISTGYYGHAYTPVDGNDNAIGSMTAQIVNNKTNLTYPVTIREWGNMEDTSVVVDSATVLPGGEYTLYVRGVSDDIGNTSNTLSIPFTVDGKIDDSFKILAVLADKSYNAASGSGIYDLNNANQAGYVGDAIYVEFSTQYAAAPIANSVLNTQNWTINGAALPVGSTIIQGISGMWTSLNGDGTVTNNSGITICLPDGTLSNVDSTSVKIASNVVDVTGKQISGKTTLNTQTIFVDSTFDGTNNIRQDGTVINSVSSGQINK